MNKKTISVILVAVIFSSGFIIPEAHRMPVQGATAKDWNPHSFWYYPWGRSRVHKGIDIFSQQDTPVLAPTQGFILYNGSLSLGGQVVYMLGPKWRFHYFAHLRHDKKKRWGFVKAGEQIGRVGTTGNARGKSPHLHYSIKSLFPYFWEYDPDSILPWEHMFFLDPGQYLMAETPKKTTIL